MTGETPRRNPFGRLALLLLVTAGWTAGMGEVEAATPHLVRLAGRSPDPWLPTEVMPAQLLAERLAGKSPPAVISVSNAWLYGQAHVRGARHFGDPGSPAGREQLSRAFARLPKDRELVLYCGCCDFTDCPNVRAGYSLARQVRPEGLRVLYLPTSLYPDWVERGYATEKKS